MVDMMLVLNVLMPALVVSFSPARVFKVKQHRRSSSSLFAAPQRLADNAEGVLYVNDKCIDCSACQYFAPSVFKHSTRHSKHVVKKQPDIDNAEEVDQARAALSACPVAAIRVDHHATASQEDHDDESLGQKLAINPKTNGLHHPFPRLLVQDVWFVGHHNEASFGAVPYVVKGAKTHTTVLVDTPKYSPSAVRTVQSICGEQGPNYLFLTHVDDTADHAKWAQRFPNMKRIFHSGDLGRYNWLGDTSLEHVEVLLQGKSSDLSKHDARQLKAWTLDGNDYTFTSNHENEDNETEFVIVHTPGHSYGSISLLYRPNGDVNAPTTTLFTGDTLAYSAKAGGLSGLGQYGRNMKLQHNVLLSLLDLSTVGFPWSVIAPGHGRYQMYAPQELETRRREEVTAAAEYLLRR